MNWTPIGSPSSLQWSGTDIAGWPVTLMSGVNGVKSVCRAKARYGSPSVSSNVQPIGDRRQRERRGHDDVDVVPERDDLARELLQLHDRGRRTAGSASRAPLGEHRD